MEGYEKKWRGCIEEDWTEWIGSKTLVYYIVLYGVITLVLIYYIVYEHNPHLNYELINYTEVCQIQNG